MMEVSMQHTPAMLDRANTAPRRSAVCLVMLCAALAFVPACKTPTSHDDTASLALSQGLPASRVPALLGSSPSQDGSSGNGSSWSGNSGDQPGREQLVWPTTGQLSSGFGPRGRRMHNGIDIRAPRGTLVRPAAAGRVIFSGTKRGYGKTVIIRHGGFDTLYAHLNRSYVRAGAEVTSGMKLGEVGRTGNATGTHLHFEKILPRGPTDPMPFFKVPRLLSSLPARSR